MVAEILHNSQKLKSKLYTGIESIPPRIAKCAFNSSVFLCDVLSIVLNINTIKTVNQWESRHPFLAIYREGGMFMKVTIIFSILCGFLITGARAQSIPPSVTGNGMKADLSAGYDQQTTFARQTESDSSMVVYPNPAVNQLWLRVSPLTRRIYRVTFFDSNGRTLSQQEYSADAGSQKILLDLPAYDSNTAVSGSALYVKIEASGQSAPTIVRVLRQW